MIILAHIRDVFLPIVWEFSITTLIFFCFYLQNLNGVKDSICGCCVLSLTHISQQLLFSLVLQFSIPVEKLGDISYLRTERHSREIGKMRGKTVTVATAALNEEKVVNMKWRKKIKRWVYSSFWILTTEKIKSVGIQSAVLRKPWCSEWGKNQGCGEERELSLYYDFLPWFC